MGLEVSSHQSFDIVVYMVHYNYPKWSTLAMSTRKESANEGFRKGARP